MPRQMPTTPGQRILRSSPRRKPPPRVPNRRPRFPTSTPPPGPSAHPSGFSIRSQQGSISFNPAAFKAPVRTSVATEFNSGERIYSSTIAFAVYRKISDPQPAYPPTTEGRSRRNSPATKSSGCLSAKREPRRDRKGPSGGYRGANPPRCCCVTLLCQRGPTLLNPYLSF